jgi:Putative DNA-binding domain
MLQATRSAVPTLLELQTAIRDHLLDDTAIAASALLYEALVPADRLSIYRNTSRATLTKALRLNFPAVERIVGEEFFAAVADRFITQKPPHAAWLDLYGESFPDFLKSFEPAATLVYLPDVARLEWRVSRALHAVEVQALEYSKLLNIDPSAQARLCFAAHPSVSFLSSPYPVDEIWRAVLARDNTAMKAIDLASGPIRLLIERRSGEVEIKRLDQPRWTFAEALLTGEPLAAALEAAGHPDAVLWLAEHLAAGHFADFQVEPTRRALEEIA